VSEENVSGGTSITHLTNTTNNAPLLWYHGITGYYDALSRGNELKTMIAMRTICPGADSISCPVGQNFLGKCVHIKFNSISSLPPRGRTPQKIGDRYKKENNKITIANQTLK